MSDQTDLQGILGIPLTLLQVASLSAAALLIGSPDEQRAAMRGVMVNLGMSPVAPQVYWSWRVFHPGG